MALGISSVISSFRSTMSVPSVADPERRGRVPPDEALAELASRGRPGVPSVGDVAPAIGGSTP